MSRTRVPRWTPRFVQSLRLALRPAVAYLVFTGGGFVAFLAAFLLSGEGRNDLLEICLAILAGFFGIVAGQLVSILRARAFPVFLVGSASAFAGIWLISASHAPLPREVVPIIAFFCLAFPCGMLSLQHRWELFASFWPAVGWIGGVFVILNREGRIRQWEQDKLTAWLPVPLLFLAGFLVTWLFYLSAKQAMRVELWQSLSGAAARRVSKKSAVGALPRKNIVPLLLAAAVLFVVTAVLAPYLWRTGKGDRKGTHEGETGQQEDKPRRGPEIDGESIVRTMKQLAEAAKNTGMRLWPLLFLFLLYRPAKRAILSRHLLKPIAPTPPTERIENLWEYVRIAAEDAKVVPHASDSVEQLLVKIREQQLGGPGVAQAAAIYARTRYGFTVASGDPLAMRPAAIEAAKELRVNLGTWDRVKNWWRPLS
jgi:hypothetical protein